MIVCDEASKSEHDENSHGTKEDRKVKKGEKKNIVPVFKEKSNKTDYLLMSLTWSNRNILGVTVSWEIC